MEETRVGKYRIDMAQRREETVYKIVDTDKNRTLPGDHSSMTLAILNAMLMENREKLLDK